MSSNLDSLPKRSNQWYGWKPDLPDLRDHIYYLTLERRQKTIPPTFDLTKDNGGPDSKYTIQDQGQLGSCTGNGIAAAFAVCNIIEDLQQNKFNQSKIFSPSRLFIYYNERVIEGTVNEDAGAMIRDGIKSVNKLGVCREDFVPYDIAKFTQKPSNQAYQEAKFHQALKYQRITNNDVNTMKSVIASGYPFVFGFSVYQSFESDEVAKTGIVPMPSQNEQLLGGHCVVAVGYDDSKKLFKCRNSWGTDWGDKGYFYMPYDYLGNSNLADDLWVITIVEESDQ